MSTERDKIERVADARLEVLSEDRAGYRITFGVREIEPLRWWESLSLIDEVRRAREWARKIKAEEALKEGAG